MKRSLGTKLYYSIGEVAELTQLQPHTLRAWEKEFSCLHPKRMGKNRAYRERDIGIILLIHRLLYQERYSTRGAQLRLRDEPELIQSATDNVAALLQGDASALSNLDSAAVVQDVPAEHAPLPPVEAESSPQEAVPETVSAPSELRSGAKIKALRQQVLSELRELVSLLR